MILVQKVSLEDKFLLTALVNTALVNTKKNFDNVFTTGGNNIVEVFESLTISFERWTHRCLADI